MTPTTPPPQAWREPLAATHPRATSRWPTMWRYTVASLPLLVVLLILLAAPVSPETQDVAIRPLDVVELLLFPLGFVVIPHRRRHPLAVALILTVAMSLSSALIGFWAWAVLSMATRRRWPWVLVTGVVTVAASIVTVLLTRSDPMAELVGEDGEIQPDQWLVLGGLVVVTGLIWYAALVAWGFYIGARRDLLASLTERALTAEREQALRVAQAQSDERARIAREMHDVLAHRISLVSMHAGVLAYRDNLSAEQTREIAQIIQENSAESLTELRAVLGTLRGSGGSAPEKPQPTLADLPGLVADARAAGTDVTVRDELAAGEALPPLSGRHAYRIVQEALTNARKHAVGAPVTVSLSGGRGDGLEIEVSNPLTTSGLLPGAGLGLVGIAERAQIAGGRCTAGPEEGRFVVRAWLPWQ